MIRARQWVLARRPDGTPAETDFELRAVQLPDPGPEEVRVRNLWLSVDPYMRLSMSGQAGLHAPIGAGDPLGGGAVGRVVESNAAELPAGTFVLSMEHGWRDEYVARAKGLQRLDPKIGPVQRFLGVYGLTGITAWAGVNDLLGPSAGNSLFVSGAAGAVGSVVVQLAKQKGCRVIASAGSERKTAWLRDRLGADETIDHRREDLLGRLRAFAPKGIDLFFDNVGGSHFEAALDAMRPRGRIALCGMIEQYDSSNYRAGPRNLFAAIEKGLTLRGLNAGFYFSKSAEIIADLARMADAGELVVEETAIDGLERTATAFLGVLSGDNLGKMLVRLPE